MPEVLGDARRPEANFARSFRSGHGEFRVQLSGLPLGVVVRSTHSQNPIEVDVNGHRQHLRAMFLC